MLFLLLRVCQYPCHQFINALCAHDSSGYSMGKVRNRAFFSSRRFSVNLVTYPEGHQVLRHNDPMGGGRYFKFNIVLKQPAQGGIFAADSVIFNWFNRVILFRPDLHSHSVSRIEQGQRKLLSMAFLLP